MKVMTRAKLGETAAMRWKEQYFDLDMGFWRNDRTLNIYNHLLACDGDPDAIDSAVGNKSWTHMMCDFCCCAVPAAIERVVHDDLLTICVGCVIECSQCVSESTDI